MLDSFFTSIAEILMVLTSHLTGVLMPSPSPFSPVQPHGPWLDNGVCLLSGSSLLPLSPSSQFSTLWPDKSSEVSHSVTLTNHLAGSVRLCVTWPMSTLAHVFCEHLLFLCRPAASLFADHCRLLAFVLSFSMDILSQTIGGFLSFRFS